MTAPWEFGDHRPPLLRLLRGALVRLAPEYVYRVLRFRRLVGRFPNLANPVTFSDKLLFKSLHDRRKILTVLADKYRVRDLVRQQVGDAISFPNVYAVYDDWRAITVEGLPSSFVLKPNHGSGWVKICREGDPIDLTEICEVARRWLAGTYYTHTKEWYYRDIKPVVYFEEVLLHQGQLATQYQVFCFSGNPAIIRVRPHPATGQKRATYDINWNKLEIVWNSRRDETAIAPRPAGLEEMCRLAARLSTEADLLRVDLYDIDGRVYFGEFTSFPINGCSRLRPETYDRELGQKWQLPTRYVD